MNRRSRRLTAAIVVALIVGSGCAGDATDSSPSPASETSATDVELTIEEFDIPAGSHPHDVAPAAEGDGVWYTAQGSGELGLLDPSDGSVDEIALGSGSSPHGVIVGPDGAPWITDSGLDAIVRVDPETQEVETFPLPDDAPEANLNTAAFDNDDVLWFTGQNGVYGRLDTKSDSPKVEVFDAPRGRGPYGITATPDGDVYYASLAGNHIARVDGDSGEATVIDPPGNQRGPRRVWSDSAGNIWISEWDAGSVGKYDPGQETWQEWELPGENAQTYAVFVDDQDIVWVSDFGSNALLRFDPSTEKFTSLELPASPGNVRQIHGRAGEVWSAESAADALVRIRT